MKEVANKTKILILVVIAIIIGIVIFIGIKKSKEFTRDNAKELMAKTEQYNNFTITNTNNNEKVLVKDEIYIQKSKNMYFWKDFKNNEAIAIITDDKYSDIQVMVKKDVENSYEGLKYYLRYINNDNYDYKFIENRKYNEKDCIIIELESIYENTYMRLYIDRTTGITVKAEHYKLNNNKKEIEEIEKYDVVLNSVTDSDVVRPDLSKYNNIEEI